MPQVDDEEMRILATLELTMSELECYLQQSLDAQEALIESVRHLEHVRKELTAWTDIVRQGHKRLADYRFQHCDRTPKGPSAGDGGL